MSPNLRNVRVPTEFNDNKVYSKADKLPYNNLWELLRFVKNSQ
ncbi:hypothetical protein LEP1GSC125_0416 [Leptospira mayottensis 200901122]|uniref:Uncharacterized protein n=1 Tax=Leptospira mayottensis 200901122 TaxID=1193010 RepID=A0AA87MPS9_9LEPT|nr:hypothetical protein LEP1GSC125_0416 [Leptospira mayottensis 200901122]